MILKRGHHKRNKNSCKINLNWARTGDKHPAWKEDAGKSAMHEWVKKHRGRASDYTCVLCEKKPAQHWANKKHDYKRNLDDYMAVCAKCHKKWDKENNKKAIPEDITYSPINANLITAGAI